MPTRPLTTMRLLPTVAGQIEFPAAARNPGGQVTVDDEQAARARLDARLGTAVLNVQDGLLEEQGVLFEPAAGSASASGYRGTTACTAAGITYRQLDYWARTGLVEPSIRAATGSGSSRLYSFRDILVLKVVKRLLDAGVSLQNIRKAIAHLPSHGVADLAQITLLSDGATVYACVSPDEVIDLLAGGQGVFGIAVGRVVREVEGSLAALPAEPSAEPSSAEPSSAESATGGDELSTRRRRRTTA